MDRLRKHPQSVVARWIGLLLDGISLQHRTQGERKVHARARLQARRRPGIEFDQYQAVVFLIVDPIDANESAESGKGADTVGEPGHIAMVGDFPDA